MNSTHDINGQRYAIKVDPRRFTAEGPIANEPVLCPAIGDFPVYDDAAYQYMTVDQPRNAVWEAAIKRQVAGKVVLDIGTGGHANWSLYSALCGAKKVYAIEFIDDSYRSARSRIDASNVGDIITLIRGLSTEVSLPERVDICVSDVIGPATGSEGAAAVLADAKRRFLKEDGVFIVDTSITKIAACRLSRPFRSGLGVADSDVKYINQIFELVGRPFDIRFTIENFPPAWIASSEGEMERFEFNRAFPPSDTVKTTLEIHEDGDIDGFVAWLNLRGDAHEAPLDTLRTITSWPPLFFPVFYPGQPVKQGDIIELTTVASVPAGKVNPDYRLRGGITRNGNVVQTFDFHSPHVSSTFRETPFYRQIFPAL